MKRHGKQRLYAIWKRGRFIRSVRPGRFAIITTQMIFGRLDCTSGKRAKKENRIFVHTYHDAIEYGARPCKICKPVP
ncbi:MAG: Ada metal-binding domain-containing protein [bacterium]|nr:Ada metal-binding domain-containing protein [bacterium]